MTFDFDPDTWSKDGVVERCQPDITANGQIIWIDGAAINGHQWGFYNDGEGIFIVYYMNDAGQWDQWIFEDEDAPEAVWAPHPDHFEKNVAFALSILCDPAVRAYNETLPPPLPTEPAPRDEEQTIITVTVDQAGHLIFPEDVDELPF
ncbi:MAG: hypothetical protein OWQ57_08475 [Sulfobacillus sp.]|nr:hypothetical protein [Sulfobacillus sp.]